MAALKRTIVECLTVIGVTVEAFGGAESVEDEFAAIKKIYFRRILVTHPDKGGDPALFREVQTNWEVLRELYDKGKVHSKGFVYYFSGEGKQHKAENVEVHAAAFSDPNRPMPSWDWFAEAADEPVPAYRVEKAKSGRSACKAPELNREGEKHDHCHHTSDIIEKGELRFGSIVPETGSCKLLRLFYFCCLIG